MAAVGHPFKHPFEIIRFDLTTQGHKTKKIYFNSSLNLVV